MDLNLSSFFLIEAMKLTGSTFAAIERSHDRNDVVEEERDPTLRDGRRIGIGLWGRIPLWLIG